MLELGHLGQPLRLKGSMQTLVSEPVWFSCSDCKLEFARLNNGLCLDCESKRAAIAKRRLASQNVITEALGQEAWDEFTIGQFKPEEGQMRALKAVQEFNHKTDNLYLWGEVGTGKTHLAVALIRQYLDRPIQAIKYPELNRQFRGLTVAQERDLLRRLTQPELLLIDDIGLGETTEYRNQTLYEIVEERKMNYRNGLIIAANLSPEHLAQKMGDNRLVDRLVQMCLIVEVKTEESWRIKQCGTKSCVKPDILNSQTQIPQ